MKASQFFGTNPGEHKCYYCGCKCNTQFLVKDYVKNTFTNRDIVACPGALYVCLGCIESMGAGPDQIDMIDGSVKVRENDRGMQPRMYSWVLTQTCNKAATKAHIARLREIILNPPEPPFAIVLADSGQKQLLFRAPVALDRSVFPVMLEDEIIEVNVEEIRELLPLAARICAALGKPALLSDLGYGSFFRYEEYFGDTDGIERWLEVRDRPLSRLVAWLSPSKEDAQHEYPGIERRSVQTEAGRVRGSGSGSSRGRSGGDKESGGQVLLDLG